MDGTHHFRMLLTNFVFSPRKTTVVDAGDVGHTEILVEENEMSTAEHQNKQGSSYPQLIEIIIEPASCCGHATRWYGIRVLSF
jgi:hypothetical protein